MYIHARFCTPYDQCCNHSQQKPIIIWVCSGKINMWLAGLIPYGRITKVPFQPWISATSSSIWVVTWPLCVRWTGKEERRSFFISFFLLCRCHLNAKFFKQIFGIFHLHTSKLTDHFHTVLCRSLVSKIMVRKQSSGQVLLKTDPTLKQCLQFLLTPV